MKLEEALIRLDEEELFEKIDSVDMEQSDIMKNLGTIANMIKETVENLKSRDILLYEDVSEEKVWRINIITCFEWSLTDKRIFIFAFGLAIKLILESKI